MFLSPTLKARDYDFIREAKIQNTGQRVESIQVYCGGKKGDSWCAYFTTMILDICFKGKSPIPREGSVQVIYELALKNAWMTTDPVVDDLFIYINSSGRAHHIGIVTKDGGSIGIAGNTSPDGKSSNGDGVYEHSLVMDLQRVKYIHYPR